MFEEQKKDGKTMVIASRFLTYAFVIGLWAVLPLQAKFQVGGGAGWAMMTGKRKKALKKEPTASEPALGLGQEDSMSANGVDAVGLFGYRWNMGVFLAPQIRVGYTGTSDAFTFEVTSSAPKWSSKLSSSLYSSAILQVGGSFLGLSLYGLAGGEGCWFTHTYHEDSSVRDWTKTSDNWVWGWTVGGGISYGLGPVDVGVEYTYTGYADIKNNFNDPDGTPVVQEAKNLGRHRVMALVTFSF